MSSDPALSSSAATSSSPAAAVAAQPLLGNKAKDGVDHTEHVLGRRRRASVITRLIGHFHYELDKPALITAILLLEKNPGIDVLRKTILERVMRIPRFRSKLVLNRKSGGYFEEVTVDVGYHFEVFGFGKKVSREELNHFVESIQEWPMDVEKPLWKMVHIPELEEGGSAVIFVIHHAIGDGISLVDVLLDLVDESDKLNPDTVSISKRAKAPKLSFYKRTNAFMKGINQGMTMPLWKQDRPNPLKFKGKCGKGKLIASSGNKIELKRVKQVAKQFANEHISVNDVLLATLTKAVATYFKDHCETDPAKLERKVRTQFLVNTRNRNEPVRNEHGDPYNAFSYGIMPLPLDAHKDFKTMMLRIKAEIDMIKHSPAFKLGRAQLPYQVKTTPLPLILDLMDNLNNIATITISNVPGPQQQVSLAGAPIKVREIIHRLVGICY